MSRSLQPSTRHPSLPAFSAQHPIDAPLHLRYCKAACMPYLLLAEATRGHGRGKGTASCSASPAQHAFTRSGSGALAPAFTSSRPSSSPDGPVGPRASLRIHSTAGLEALAQLRAAARRTVVPGSLRYSPGRVTKQEDCALSQCISCRELAALHCAASGTIWRNGFPRSFRQRTTITVRGKLWIQPASSEKHYV